MMLDKKMLEDEKITEDIERLHSGGNKFKEKQLLDTLFSLNVLISTYLCWHGYRKVADLCSISGV